MLVYTPEGEINEIAPAVKAKPDKGILSDSTNISCCVSYCSTRACGDAAVRLYSGGSISLAEESLMPVSLHAMLRAIGIRVMVAREWWQSGVTYNPLAPRTYKNPYPTYARLRTKDPVHWSPLMASWVLSRYEDVDTILRDHKRFSSDARNRRSARRRQRL